MDNICFDGDKRKTMLIRNLESVFRSLAITAIIFGILVLMAWPQIAFNRTEFFCGMEKFALVVSMVLFMALFSAILLLIMCSEDYVLVAKICRGSILVLREGQKTRVMKIFEKDEFFMRKDKIFFKPLEMIDIPVIGTARITVHPITENPKIRNISCCVKVIANREIAVLQQLIDVWGIENTSSWEKKIQSFLYDFAEKFSIQLGKFFNPMNNEQQEEFERMVHDFFDGKILSAGLVIKSASFDID
jgi:hypothetical protein